MTFSDRNKSFEERDCIHKQVLTHSQGQYFLDGKPVTVTKSYRVECCRCLQYIGVHCVQPLGFVAYIPELKRKRAICLECCDYELFTEGLP